MNSNKKDDELAREIRAHLALEAEERMVEGMSAEDARAAARRAFGYVTRVREDARAVWIAPALDHVWQDLRYAARRLRRAPAFAATAILLLTVGIGLNLGFFQMMNVVALQPPRVADAGTLVRFDRITKSFSSNGFPYPATQFIRQQNDVMSAVLTSSGTDVVWGDDLDERVEAMYVSANWFTELGYAAAAGRVFVEAIDESPDAAPVVVVSHAFWRTRLQGEPVVGRVVRVNARPATIAGVAPEGFPGLRIADTQVWLPITQMAHFNPGSAFAADWGAHNTQMYGRLRPGVSAAAAQAGLRGTIAELARIRPAEFAADEVLQPYTGANGFRTPRDENKLRTIAALVGGLMLLVLAVACANLSSLILSQAIGRAREFSMRAALGASRWRLLRQQLVETAFISALGAAGGIVAGYWFARFIAVQTSLPSHLDLTPDWRMTLAACVIAGLVTLVTGFVPAWMVSKRDVVAAMKDGGQQSARGLARGRFRLALLGAQIAGCCVLLVVAGAMVRGLQRMLAPNLGFEYRQIAVLDPSLSRYDIRGDAARAYWDQVKQTLSGNPEIEAMALASHSPLGTSGSRSRYTDAPRLTVTTVVVEPGFFDLLRIPIVAGRPFDRTDPPSTTVIIGRRLALEMYGSFDIVGRGYPRSDPDRTIVGVAADAPMINVTSTNAAEQYFPAGSTSIGGLSLLVKARNDPQRLLAPLRDAARLADDRVLPKTTLAVTQYEQRLHGTRLTSVIAGLTGLLALALACFGIFGVVAHGVAMRTKEIGIRRALGADAGSVVRLLLRQLAVPIAAGIAVGVVAGVAISRALQSEPFYLPAIDAVMPLVAIALFLATAAAAALRPAARALGADPLQALRQD